MNVLKKTFVMLLALIMVLGLVACGAAEERPAETKAPAQDSEVAVPAETEAPAEPVKITIYCPDSSTAPFQEDWLALQEVAKLANAEVTIEAIPEGDYRTPFNLALDTQENCPDVIMFQEIYGSKASLCMNGGVVAISDYPEWTPDFNATAEKMGLVDQVNNLKLADGKRYIMPSLHESLEYSGGLILRADFLEANGFDAPKTFDDLYEILKAYKEQNPDSYPIVHYLFPYITHRMIMPAWSCPDGYWVPPYLGSIAWDYENYYITTTADVYCEYLQFMNKLADEGLLFPAATAEREDFEQVVRAIDTMFYSEEAAKIWSIGVEGVTYNVVDGKVEFVDAVKNAPEGVNKYLQINYGCGTSGFQSMWPDEYTLMKFDEEYAEIYAAASEMGANQPYAPEPWFDDFAASLQEYLDLYNEYRNQG